MLPSLVLLPCSLFALFISSVSALNARYEDAAGPLAANGVRNHRRQDDGESMDMMTSSSAVTITSEYTTTVYAATVTAQSTVTVTSAPTPTSCADLSAQPNGQPYTGPMGRQYNLQCNSFYYTDDDNTVGIINADSYRACADLCDEDAECNLFFYANENAGDQAGQCWLLIDDRYGMNSDSTLGDSGSIVGFVSQAS